MIICQSLIESAALALKPLGLRKDRAICILLDRQLPDGGFAGKGKTSDLYYTGFAVLSLLALKADFERSETLSYLQEYRFTEAADLAHRAAWIRMMKLLKPGYFDEKTKAASMEQLWRYHCDDGAWHHLQKESTGSAYGCFLFVGACQDLDVPIPSDTRDSLLRCLDTLQTPAGGYYNERDIPASAVPSTAAAMMVRKILRPEGSDQTKAGEWILKNYTGGGFRVMPLAPVADLLSTAVGLHVLAYSGIPLEPIRSACREYVNSLWNETIGFCANSIDPVSDTEYMFYGLLSLGHLSQ